MASMLDGIRELITPAFVARAAAQTGESEAAVSKGFGAVVPAMLSTLANRSDDSGFMSQVGSLASRSAGDPDAITQSALAGPSTGATGTWLSELFGSHQSGMTDSVARFAGVSSSSSTSLLRIAAPLVLGYLGRMMRSGNLDSVGLSERLRSDKRSFAAALPAGFSVPGLFKTPVEPAHVVRETAPRHYEPPPAVPRERSSGGWLAPLALAALALGALLWWGARDRPSEQVRTVTVAPASSAVGTAGTAVQAVARTLPGNIQVRVPAGSSEDRLISYLGSAAGAPSTAVTLDRIGFVSASASLTPESREQIENVARVLTAYPNATVTISGHTDNAGDEAANRSLSRERAEAVASALQEQGVSASRIRSEGYGSQNPVADNASEAGRAQNRRVVLLVER